MPVLVAYGTIEGQTGKIARHVADLVRKAGHEVRLYDTSDHDDDVDATDFDTAILAASVHERRHPVDFEIFVTAQNDALDACRTLFLSISLSAAFPEGQEEAQDYVDEMKLRTEFTPDAEMLVAGAVRKKRYDYYASQVLQHVVMRGRAYDPSEQEHEFTDWAALDTGIHAFLDASSK